MSIATSFKKAAAVHGGALKVVPIVTGPDWMEPASPVGEARSYSEALLKIRSAGYRVMHVGGLHEPSPHDDEAEFLITVHA